MARDALSNLGERHSGFLRRLQPDLVPWLFEPALWPIAHKDTKLRWRRGWPGTRLLVTGHPPAAFPSRPDQNFGTGPVLVNLASSRKAFSPGSISTPESGLGSDSPQSGSREAASGLC
jgi:hypothetical protein